MEEKKQCSRPRWFLETIDDGKQKCGDQWSDDYHFTINQSIPIPKWYDPDKFLKGQQFFQDNIFSVALSMHYSLIAGMSIPNLLEPLVFTNASNTPKKSLKRYLMTFYHIILWLTENVWDTTSKAFKSIQIVRSMHLRTASAMNKKYEDKLFISQYDMAIVQSGFFAAAVMYPEQFGIRCDSKELEAYIHVWRTLGYLLGIDDDYNICSASLDRTLCICKEIEQRHIVPNLTRPPADFSSMADAYINGINSQSFLKLHSLPTSLAMIWYGIKKTRPHTLGLKDFIRYWFWRSLLTFVYYSSFIRKAINKRILRFSTTIFLNVLSNDFYNQENLHLCEH